VFHKGRELYGLYEAREALHSAGYVLVTEGYMDVVALAQLGFANAVATLGTACTPDHVQKLFRFTDSVVFSFDGDGAGRRAARKALDGALPYATDVRSIKFLFLPAEHDPDSYVREFGQEAFAEQIKQAMPLSRFLIDAASVDCDLQTAEGRARLSSQARPLWQLLPDGALKQQLLSELAQLIQLETSALHPLHAVRRRPHPSRPTRHSARPPVQGRTNTPTSSQTTASHRPGRVPTLSCRPTATATGKTKAPTGRPASKATASTNVSSHRFTPAHAPCPPAEPTTRPDCCWATWRCGNHWPVKTTPCCVPCPHHMGLCLPGSNPCFMNKGHWAGPH
jgi:DNA primase